MCGLHNLIFRPFTVPSGLVKRPKSSNQQYLAAIVHAPIFNCLMHKHKRTNSRANIGNVGLISINRSLSVRGVLLPGFGGESDHFGGAKNHPPPIYTLVG